MIDQAPDTRKHFYDLTCPEDRERASNRIECFKQLAMDADRVWWKNGYWHILVNQLCLKFTYQKNDPILMIEWKTRRKSELEDV